MYVILICDKLMYTHNDPSEKGHEHFGGIGHGGRMMSNARRGGQDPESLLKSIGLSSGAIIADLGCGPGYFTIPMVSYVGPKGLVYAVDSSKEMLSELRKNLKAANIEADRIKIVEADISRTGIADWSVDFAFFANVLHDIGNISNFLEEAKRILKPHGTAVDIDWKKTETPFGPPFDIGISESDAIQAFKDNGFTYLKSLELDQYHYGLVFQIESKGNRGQIPAYGHSVSGTDLEIPKE